MSPTKKNTPLKVVLSSEGLRMVQQKPTTVTPVALQRIPKIPKKRSTKQDAAASKLAISPLKEKEEEEKREKQRIQAAKDQMARRPEIAKSHRLKDPKKSEKAKSITFAERKISEKKSKTLQNTKKKPEKRTEQQKFHLQVPQPEVTEERRMEWNENVKQLYEDNKQMNFSFPTESFSNLSLKSPTSTILKQNQQRNKIPQ